MCRYLPICRHTISWPMEFVSLYSGCTYLINWLNLFYHFSFISFLANFARFFFPGLKNNFIYLIRNLWSLFFPQISIFIPMNPNFAGSKSGTPGLKSSTPGLKSSTPGSKSGTPGPKSGWRRDWKVGSRENNSWLKL